MLPIDPTKIQSRDNLSPDVLSKYATTTTANAKFTRRKTQVDTFFCEFRSLDAFAQACEIDPDETDNPPPSRLTSSKDTGRYDFHYFPNFDEAANAIRYGWPEGTRRARKMLRELDLQEATGFGETFETHMDVFGGTLDVGAYVSGDVECFRRREYVQDQNQTGTNTVTINVNASTSASISKADMMRRGVAALALTMALENFGFAVDVNVGWHIYESASKPKGAVYNIPIRKAGDPINQDVFAFTLANPDMLRRMFFRALELSPERYRNAIGAGYGVPSDWETLMNQDGTIHMQAAHLDKTNWGHTASVKRWILNQLEMQGVDLAY